MVSQLSYETAICTEYEQLLSACVKALERWRNRREEITDSQATGKEAGDELLGLQADYAKAYSHLERHKYSCGLCHFVSRIAGRNDASVSTAVMERKNSP